MKVPLGERKGSLHFFIDGHNINGIFTILGHDNIFYGTLHENGMLKFSGQLELFSRKIDYQAEGHIHDTHIELHLHDKKIEFLILGEECIRDIKT